MKIDRRQVIGGIAASPFSKSILNTSKYLIGGRVEKQRPYPTGSYPCEEDKEDDPFILQKILRRLGYIPDFVKEEWKARSSVVHEMDEDIMALKSVSNTAKVRMQRRLNYRNMERNFWKTEEWYKAYKIFDKLVGGEGWRL